MAGEFPVGAIVSKLELNKKGWDASVKSVEKDQKTMANFAKKNGEAMKKMGRTMTIAGAAIVGSLGLMVKSYVETGDQIDKMSKRTGLAATFLSEMAFAADISGASLEAVEKGVKKMAKTIVDADDGMTTYIRAFDRIGLSAENLLKLSPEEQFLQIGKAIAEVESPTIRAAAAVDIFGRAGTQLLPLFAEGADGLEDLSRQAHELGIIFDEEAAAAAAKLKDEQTKLKDSFKGVSFALADTLIPMITDMVTKVTEVIKKVSAWVKENPKLAGTILKIVGGLGALMAILGPLLMILPGIIAAVGAMSAGFLAVAGPIAAVVAVLGFTITKVVKLIKVMGDLKKAKEHLIEVTKTEEDATERLFNKMERIAEVAGLSAFELAKLTIKYKGNTTALMAAIKAGKESVELQEAMVKVGKENVKAMGKQEEAVGDLSGSFEDDLIPALEDTDDEIKDIGKTIKTIGIPTVNAMAGAINKVSAIVTASMSDLEEEVEETFEEVNKFTENLINDLGNSFGRFVQGLGTKGISLRENLKNLWGDIKASFVGMIADMAKEWATNFVKNIITKSLTVNTAMAKTSAVFTTMGKTVAGIGEGIGKLISGLAKGIGKAIVTLAKSIAVAAKTLAAAAPQLLIVGGVALALMAGFKAIQSLFGGGGGKKQKKANELLQDTRNFLAEIRNVLTAAFQPVLLVDQQSRLDDQTQKLNWILAATEGILGYATAIKGYTQEIAANTKAMLGVLGAVPSAQHGGFFPEKTLAMVGEVPEIVAPVQTIQRIIEGGGMTQGRGGAEVNIHNEISPTFVTLDPMSMRDVWRKFIEPQMLDSLSTGGKANTKLKQLMGVT